jgi:hypothetical protein
MVAHQLRRRSARSRFRTRRPASVRFMAGLARAGLAARGAMYILIGVIAVQIAIGSGHHQADRSGAVRLVASSPFGSVILWLLVIGFAGMTLWRLSEAAFGAAGPDGSKPAKRAANLARGVFYGIVTFGILKYALGIGAPSSSDRTSRDLTATALHHPGGQIVVILAGLAFVAGGSYVAYRAVKAKFARRLRMAGTSSATRVFVRRLGQVGGVARGAVFGTVGVFLVIAALSDQPHKAKGIDSALRALAHTPFGPLLLIIVAAGLIIFGVYSFCEARWREV